MKSPVARELSKSIPLILSVVGSVASVVAFIGYSRIVDGFLGDRILGYVFGILGGTLGAFSVYVLTRVMRALQAPTVFVSYSMDQTKLAKKLADNLEQLPVRVLYDQNELQVGDSIGQRISELVEDSDYIVFIVSERGLESHWVKKELELALSKHKRVLPVLAEKTELPEELRNLVFADFTQSFDEGFARLRSALESRPHRARRTSQ